ncbi:hypothetical protein HK105_200882 [Polyrhizophydium stewartii]|uniref:Uncharacterized protein n=1 Tax=Polyrhizophydium stewartii TaxID=2732419 RepID=A0ABR4NI82_9FUNG
MGLPAPLAWVQVLSVNECSNRSALPAHGVPAFDLLLPATRAATLVLPASPASASPTASPASPASPGTESGELSPLDKVGFPTQVLRAGGLNAAGRACAPLGTADAASAYVELLPDSSSAVLRACADLACSQSCRIAATLTNIDLLRSGPECGQYFRLLGTATNLTDAILGNITVNYWPANLTSAYYVNSFSPATDGVARDSSCKEPPSFAHMQYLYEDCVEYNSTHWLRTDFGPPSSSTLRTLACENSACSVRCSVIHTRLKPAPPGKPSCAAETSATVLYRPAIGIKSFSEYNSATPVDVFPPINYDDESMKNGGQSSLNVALIASVSVVCAVLIGAVIAATVFFVARKRAQKRKSQFEADALLESRRNTRSAGGQLRPMYRYSFDSRPSMLFGSNESSSYTIQRTSAAPGTVGDLSMQYVPPPPLPYDRFQTPDVLHDAAGSGTALDHLAPSPGAAAAATAGPNPHRSTSPASAPPSPTRIAQHGPHTPLRPPMPQQHPQVLAMPSSDRLSARELVSMPVGPLRAQRSNLSLGVSQQPQPPQPPSSPQPPQQQQPPPPPVDDPQPPLTLPPRTRPVSSQFSGPPVNAASVHASTLQRRQSIHSLDEEHELDSNLARLETVGPWDSVSQVGPAHTLLRPR